MAGLSAGLSAEVKRRRMFLQRRKLELADLYCAGGLPDCARQTDSVGLVVQAGAPARYAVWRVRLPEGVLRTGGEEPFTNFGANAVEKLFDAREIKEVIALAKSLVA